MALAPAFIINSRSQDDHICLFQQILEHKNFKQYNKNTQRGTFRLIGKLEDIYLPVQGEPGSARRLLDLNAEFWINGSSLSRAPRCVSVIDLSAFPCRRIRLSIKPSTCSHPAAAAGRRLSICPCFRLWPHQETGSGSPAGSVQQNSDECEEFYSQQILSESRWKWL